MIEHFVFLPSDLAYTKELYPRPAVVDLLEVAQRNALRSYLVTFFIVKNRFLPRLELKPDVRLRSAAAYYLQICNSCVHLLFKNKTKFMALEEIFKVKNVPIFNMGVPMKCNVYKSKADHKAVRDRPAIFHRIVNQSIQHPIFDLQRCISLPRPFSSRSKFEILKSTLLRMFKCDYFLTDDRYSAS